jgi:hypothetical protein
MRIFEIKFYSTTVDTREELWQGIKKFANEMKNIPRILKCFRVSFSCRVELCVCKRGGHFEHFT